MLTISTYRQVKSQENIPIQNNRDLARKRRGEKLEGIKRREEKFLGIKGKEGIKDKDSEREKDT